MLILFRIIFGSRELERKSQNALDPLMGNILSFKQCLIVKLIIIVRCLSFVITATSKLLLIRCNYIDN